MKNTILLILAVVFMANYAIAQGSDDERRQFHIGLKAGANLANVYDTKGEEFNADAKLGFAGGVFFSIPIGSVLGIQPELLYSQKGFKATGRLLGNTYGLTRTSNFIDVPLLIAIKPIRYVTVLVGPQFSYLLQQKDVFNTENSNIEQIQEFENDNIRKNILGVIAGLDVNVNHLVIGARAGWDLSTNHGDGTSSTPRYKNAWIQATLGYRIF
ncbi:MAG: outer membrane beta-barrel protein [Saprospiraceae bacterium]|nr:outer membrane beta-barrel protein [Saprospiraceae bacterium]